MGAGPAGLSLARIIVRQAWGGSLTSKNHYPFSITLFDRDLSPTNPTQRPQGGSLDLHADSGQLALREAGLWDEFIGHARYDAQGWRVDDQHGKQAAQVSEDAGKDRDKPEIGRAELRTLLGQKIEEIDCIEIHWGKRCLGVSKEQGQFRIIGEDVHSPEADTTPFDLVIGADGTWSHVRPLVSDNNLHRSFCPAQAQDGSADFTAEG